MRYLVLLLLAGCPAVQTQSATGTTTPAAPTGDPNERVPAPDLTGKTEDEAKAALAAAGITGEVEANRVALECDGAAQVEGKINCQNPAAGQLMYRHGMISVTVYHSNAGAFKGSLLRAQLEPLVGMTVEDAKAQLKKLGHDGEIEIATEVQFVAKCGLNKVCEVQPESGTSIHDRITLYVNPTVKVAAPPPD